MWFPQGLTQRACLHVTNSALSQGREIVIKRTFSKKNSTVDLNRQEKELEGRLTEIVQSDSRKKKRMKRNELRLKDLWDSVKFSDISIGFPEEEKSEK